MLRSIRTDVSVEKSPEIDGQGDDESCRHQNRRAMRFVAEERMDTFVDDNREDDENCRHQDQRTTRFVARERTDMFVDETREDDGNRRHAYRETTSNRDTTIHGPSTEKTNVYVCRQTTRKSGGREPEQ